jgi:uncharacterized protein (TIGR00251 family)
MTRVMVLVKPGSRQEEVTRLTDGSLVVKVKSPAKKGKANKRLIELLADYWQVSKSRIVIDSGVKSKRKIIRILAGGRS